jgi:hypothetical protein
MAVEVLRERWKDVTRVRVGSNMEIIIRKRRLEESKHKVVKPSYLRAPSFGLPVIPNEWRPEYEKIIDYCVQNLPEINPELRGSFIPSNEVRDVLRLDVDDCLKKLLIVVKGSTLEKLSLRVVKDIANPGLPTSERLDLAEKVEGLFDTLLNKHGSPKSKVRKNPLE